MTRQLFAFVLGQVTQCDVCAHQLGHLHLTFLLENPVESACVMCPCTTFQPGLTRGHAWQTCIVAPLAMHQTAAPMHFSFKTGPIATPDLCLW